MKVSQRLGTWSAVFWLLLSPLPSSAQLYGKKSEKELTKEADAYISSKPEALKPFFHTLYMEGEWNSVLNLNLLALAPLEFGMHDIATKALDQSTARILRIYADDPNADRARSLWSAESVKDFKGEPYERAMAFLYRGLLYLEEGDLQNARASFLQSDLQNAMGQTEKYDRSFALPVYLAAWASKCDGDKVRAEDLVKQALKSGIDPYFRESGERLPSHISLIERGLGPEKVTLGDARSVLGFLPQPDIRGSVLMMYASPPAAPLMANGTAGNVDWLALTRGGRPIQGVLDGKASFKETTGSIANISGQVASTLYQSLGQLGPDKLSVMKSMAGLGAGVQVLGMFAGMASRNTDSEADTRYWASLPKTWTLQAYDGGRLTATGLQTSHASKPRPIAIQMKDHPTCSFAFAREFSALSATSGGVGNPSPWPAEPRETDRVKANEAFRQYLKSAL